MMQPTKVKKELMKLLSRHFFVVVKSLIRGSKHRGREIGRDTGEVVHDRM